MIARKREVVRLARVQVWNGMLLCSVFTGVADIMLYMLQINYEHAHVCDSYQHYMLV